MQLFFETPGSKVYKPSDTKNWKIKLRTKTLTNIENIVDNGLHFIKQVRVYNKVFLYLYVLIIDTLNLIGIFQRGNRFTGHISRNIDWKFESIKASLHHTSSSLHVL